MKYCRFCGKELVDGRCSCEEFLESIGENGSSWQPEREEKTKDPILAGPFVPNLTSVSAFFSSLREYSGMGEANSDHVDPYERDVPIVPDCIEQEANETVVKQYNIAILRTRLKGMKAEGRMMVTTRRILFRAAGTSPVGNILQEHQFNLDEIGGVEMHKDYKFSLMNFFGSWLIMVLALSIVAGIFIHLEGAAGVVFGLLLGIAGLVPTFILYKRFWWKLLAAMAGTSCFLMSYILSGQNGFLAFIMFLSAIITIADLLIVCFVPNLVIKVKAKGADGAVVIGSQKSMFSREIGDDYTGFVEVLPWEDTMLAMNEIGTMIDDLQKQGDYAVDKWTQ